MGDDRSTPSSSVLHAALGAASIGVWSWALDSGALSWSPEQYALLGLSPDQPPSFAAWERVIHPDDRPTMLAFVAELRERPRLLCRTEFRVVTPRGVRWLQAVGHLEDRPEFGGCTLLGVNIDVTDRKAAEAALETSRNSLHAQYAELESIYGTVPVGLCILDRELRYVRINERLAEINGIPASAHLGRTVHEIVPDIADAVARMLRPVFETGAPVLNFELTGETAAQPGVKRTWVEHYFPVRGPNGDVIAISLVAEEITERLRTERELRDADRRKDEFLATLAHELRNPLAPIRSAAAVLRRPSTEPGAREWATAIIERQVQTMARLLDDLLDVSRITRGKLPLQVCRLTLQSAVEGAIEVARPLIDARRHVLSVALPSQPILIDADAVRLGQVFSNLLTNAAKYTDPGGSIQLRVELEAERVCISVSDNGIGLDSDSLSHIFEMFSQVKSALDRSDGGLGIGLAFARGIVELHGGSIWAHSDGLGRGSVFRVYLPVARAAVVPEPSINASVPRALAQSKRVLVADDNVDAAHTLAMLLQLSGHDVRLVHDGEAAVREALAFRPDVALIDIGMPGLNGYEVAERLRTTSWRSRARLIALTGWGQSEDEHRAAEAGFDQHVTKPLDPEWLPTLIEGPASEHRDDDPQLRHRS